MEALDIESKHSYVGSFLQPPDKITPAFAHFWSKKAAATIDTSAPNNQALVSALKTLQEKIHRLELERSQAEDDLNCLSREAAQYKIALQSQYESKKDVSHQELMQETKDVSMQLGEAQSRCSLLEKQLDYMRSMMINAELEKKLILEKQTQLQKEKDQNQVELCAKLDKLEILERECLRLTGTQKAAEEKIKQLEEKLVEEQHQRKLIQDKAAQLQTGLEMNRILVSALSPKKEAKKKSERKKPIKKNSVLKKQSGTQPSLQPVTLPFLAGKSSSSSHSLVANVQSVLHMMKYHSPQVTLQCSEAADQRTDVCRPDSCSTASSVSENLSDLLLVLQDELGRMSFEHQELLKHIQETENANVRENLERELDRLVAQMEVKGEQISKLKKHQENVYKMRQKAQKLKRKTANIVSRPEKFEETKETVVLPRVHGTSSVNKSASSLQLLKTAQRLQLVLKKDDIIWEP